MNKLLFTLLLALAGSAQAADPALLERALRCELQDAELAQLLPALAAHDKGFARPAGGGGAPSYDVYRTATSVSVHGYSAGEIVVMPATILLAVGGKPLADAVKALKLEGDAYSPAVRAVRPGVEIIALSLGSLPGKMLVGCRYANNAAAAWVKGFSL